MSNPKIKVEVEVEVPREDWIEFLTQYNDIFGSGYCGYWLRGVEHDPKLGWLCFEDDESHLYGEEPKRKQAIAAWRAGKELPRAVSGQRSWYRLDEAAAIEAYRQAVMRWGVGWMDGPYGDGNGYDVAIQLALLGEERYG